MRRGVVRSAEERQRLISGWKASGLSVPVFAKQQGVPATTLYQWLAAARRSAAPPRIVRVIPKPPEAVPSDRSLTVEVGGAVVRVPAGFDRATLAAVLDVLDMRSRERRP